MSCQTCHAEGRGFLETVNSEIQPNRGFGGDPLTPIPFPLIEPDSLERARVVARQQLLFPPSPKAVCEEIGLNWWAAVKLFEDGFLSFPPEHTDHLDEAQEAELRFVGALVVVGCDRPLVARLLAGLPKPYAYALKQVYYDWGAKCWRLIPDPMRNPEDHFSDWLQWMVQSRDIGNLAGIIELTQDALTRVQDAGLQREF